MSEKDPFAASLAALKAAIEWGKTIPRGTGASTVLERPTCKGKLYVAKASCNGHLRAQCETDGCARFIQ